MIGKKQGKFVDSDVGYWFDDSVAHVFWEEDSSVTLLDETIVIQTDQQ